MKSFLALSLICLITPLLAINPSREYEKTPADYGLKYSQYNVETPDGYSIKVWEYESDTLEFQRTVIFVGPDAGNMSHSIWQANFFLEKGIRVISFDYRGFGQSSDFEMNKDFLFYSEFATDLDTVIKSVRKKFSNDTIGLYALSMGTYVSLIRKEKIDFLVAEGFFTDPYKVVDRIKVNKSKVVLMPADAKAVQELLPSIPILIFCATNDVITTMHDATEFSAKNNVAVVEFKGDHLTGFHTMTELNPGDLYLSKITDFLKENNL